MLGGAGTGKTQLLAERFAWLAAHGTRAGGDPRPRRHRRDRDRPARADRGARHDALRGARASPPSATSARACCATRRSRPASTRSPRPVAPGDRLATLLERIDELPLASHDLRGNPSALLGSIVGRIDRLKDELVTAEDYAAWAATLPEETEPDRARAAREREFGAIYAAHDRMLAEAGTLDYGDLVVHAFRLLREKPHVRARLAGRYAHVLVDDFQDASFAQTLLLRLLASEHASLTVAADDDQAITRFRGASTKGIADFRADWPDATVVQLEESHRVARARARRRRAR